jgi:hypothetical protein
MSIASEISRLGTAISAIKASITNKDNTITIPPTAKIADLSGYIDQITVGGSGGRTLVKSGTFTSPGYGSSGFVINGFATQSFDNDSVFELNLTGKCNDISTFSILVNINSDYAGSSPNSVKTILSNLTNSIVYGIGGKYMSLGNATTIEEIYKIYLYKNKTGKICATSLSSTAEYFCQSAFTYNEITSLRISNGNGDGLACYFVGDVSYSLYKVA